MIASLDEHGFPDAALRSTLPVMVVFTTAWAGSFHIVRATLESIAYQSRDKLAKKPTVPNEHFFSAVV